MKTGGKASIPNALIPKNPLPTLIAAASVQVATTIGALAIVALTASGTTALRVARVNVQAVRYSA